VSTADELFALLGYVEQGKLNALRDALARIEREAYAAGERAGIGDVTIRLRAAYTAGAKLEREACAAMSDAWPECYSELAAAIRARSAPAVADRCAHGVSNATVNCQYCASGQRRPLPPEVLAVARQDTVHSEVGRYRAAQTVRVRLPRDVHGDWPFYETVAPAGEYDARSNAHGALWVTASDGSDLGIKPGEFELVTPAASDDGDHDGR